MDDNIVRDMIEELAGTITDAVSKSLRNAIAKVIAERDTPQVDNTAVQKDQREFRIAFDASKEDAEALAAIMAFNPKPPTPVTYALVWEIGEASLRWEHSGDVMLCGDEALIKDILHRTVMALVRYGDFLELIHPCDSEHLPAVAKLLSHAFAAHTSPAVVTDLRDNEQIFLIDTDKVVMHTWEGTIHLRIHRSKMSNKCGAWANNLLAAACEVAKAIGKTDLEIPRVLIPLDWAETFACRFFTMSEASFGHVADAKPYRKFPRPNGVWFLPASPNATQVIVMWKQGGAGQLGCLGLHVKTGVHHHHASCFVSTFASISEAWHKEDAHENPEKTRPRSEPVGNAVVVKGGPVIRLPLEANDRPSVVVDAISQGAGLDMVTVPLYKIDLGSVPFNVAASRIGCLLLGWSFTVQTNESMAKIGDVTLWSDGYLLPRESTSDGCPQKDRILVAGIAAIARCWTLPPGVGTHCVSVFRPQCNEDTHVGLRIAKRLREALGGDYQNHDVWFSPMGSKWLIRDIGDTIWLMGYAADDDDWSSITDLIVSLSDVVKTGVNS